MNWCASLFLSLTIAMPLVPAVTSTAADTVAPFEAQLTADQIIDRYAAALGGYEKIRKINSVIFRGVYREQDFVSDDGALVLMRPYYKLVGDPDRPSKEFSEGYDGSSWEFYGDPGIVLRTTGAAAAAARHHTDVDGPLIDYRDKGSTVTLDGTESIAGRKAYRLRVRMKDGFEEEEFVDAETWLLIASRKVAPVHAFGNAIASETRFGDFRAVEGVLFSYSSKEVEIGTGKVLNEMTMTSITANQRLDPAIFSPPVFPHTPLQRLIEQLFAERTDVSAVLWSYRDFRRAYPEVNTDEGMEVAGYQILKMGDHAAAVALLEANAAEYPQSSGAAFGLGRAYVTSGNVSGARVEFRKALALDANNKRAGDALKALPPE